MPAEHPFQKAEWLWPGLPSSVQNAYADFRRDFRLGKAPRSAPFFITADQNYMLYLNGRYVGRGPARGFQSHWPYDEHDLAPLLRRGHNWISVRVYNSGASCGQYLHQGVAGLICAGAFGGVDLATNASWIKRLTPETGATPPGFPGCSIFRNTRMPAPATSRGSLPPPCPRDGRWIRGRWGARGGLHALALI